MAFGRFLSFPSHRYRGIPRGEAVGGWGFEIEPIVQGFICFVIDVDRDGYRSDLFVPPLRGALLSRRATCFTVVSFSQGSFGN